MTIPGEPALKGTLTLPEAGPSGATSAAAGPGVAGGTGEAATAHGFPAVLLIAGSGAVDRDENTPNTRLEVFSRLAPVIAELDFAVLRYDKRGVGESEGDFVSTGLWDLVHDAERVLDYLRGRPEIDPDRVIILGHSEGAWLAPAVYHERPGEVAGLILVAGAAKSLRPIIIWQGDQAIAELEKARTIQGFFFRLFRMGPKTRLQSLAFHQQVAESTEDVMNIKGQRINAKWLREHFDYDPAEPLAEVTCPVLAVTGEKDLQSPPEEAEVIAECVSGPSEWAVIEGMNHILRRQDEKPSMLALRQIYARLTTKPLHPEFVSRVSEWLRDRKKEWGLE